MMLFSVKTIHAGWHQAFWLPALSMLVLACQLGSTEALDNRLGNSFQDNEFGHINSISMVPLGGRHRRSLAARVQNPQSTSSNPNNIPAKFHQTHLAKQLGKRTTKISPSTHEQMNLSTYKNAHFDVRDVAYFLESHRARSVHDPRVYFTEERTSRSLAIMLHELSSVPNQLRFAYVVRIFNELGCKIASQLNLTPVRLSPC